MFSIQNKGKATVISYTTTPKWYFCYNGQSARATLVSDPKCLFQRFLVNFLNLLPKGSWQSSEDLPNTVLGNTDGNFVLKLSYTIQIKSSQLLRKYHTPLLNGDQWECDHFFCMNYYEGSPLPPSQSVSLMIPNFRLSNPLGTVLHTLATNKELVSLAGLLLHSAEGGP